MVDSDNEAPAAENQAPAAENGAVGGNPAPQQQVAQQPVVQPHLAQQPPQPPPQPVVPNVTPPPPIEWNSSSPSDTWKTWEQMWRNYLIISGLDTKEPKFLSALLLHCIGPKALQLYNSMQFRADQDRQDPELILQKYREYFMGESKEFFERFKFNKRNQEACYDFVL